MGANTNGDTGGALSLNAHGWWVRKRNGAFHLAPAEDAETIGTPDRAPNSPVSRAACGERLDSVSFQHYSNGDIGRALCPACAERMPLNAALYGLASAIASARGPRRDDSAAWLQAHRNRTALLQAQQLVADLDPSGTITATIAAQIAANDAAVAAAERRYRTDEQRTRARQDALQHLVRRSLGRPRRPELGALAESPELARRWAVLERRACNAASALGFYLSRAHLGRGAGPDGAGCAGLADMYLAEVDHGDVIAATAAVAHEIRIDAWDPTWATLGDALHTAGRGWLTGLVTDTFRFWTGQVEQLLELADDDETVRFTFDAHQPGSGKALEMVLPFGASYDDKRVTATVPVCVAVACATKVHVASAAGPAAATTAIGLLHDGTFESPAKALAAAIAVLARPEGPPDGSTRAL